MPPSRICAGAIEQQIGGIGRDVGALELEHALAARGLPGAAGERAAREIVETVHGDRAAAVRRDDPLIINRSAGGKFITAEKAGAAMHGNARGDRQRVATVDVKRTGGIERGEINLAGAGQGLRAREDQLAAGDLDVALLEGQSAGDGGAYDDASRHELERACQGDAVQDAVLTLADQLRVA